MTFFLGGLTFLILVAVVGSKFEKRRKQKGGRIIR